MGQHSSQLQPDPLELLTVEDVCRLLKVKRSWVYDQVGAGKLPKIKVGNHLRFRRSAIERLLTEAEQ